MFVGSIYTYVDVYACIDVGCTRDTVQMDGCLVVGGGRGARCVVGRQLVMNIQGLGNMVVWLMDCSSVSVGPRRLIWSGLSNWLG